MKRIAWIALLALVAIMLVPVAYMLAGRAHAERGVAATTAKAAAAVQGSGNLVFRGGPVQTQPVSYLIFWGPSWSSGGTLTSDGQIAKNYFTDVGGTFYFDTLTQYSNISAAHTLAAVYLDTSAPPTDTSCGTATIQDSAIRSEVSKAITTQGWSPNYSNATFYVYTPAGTVVNDGSGACAPRQFCAYHNWSSTGGFSYAAIAYPSDLTACGVASSPNGNVQGDSLASLSARVQFGAITDPQPAPIKTGTTAGWLDNAAYEIGDKCGWDTSAGLITLKNNHTYALQTEYSNATSACIGSYHSHFQSTAGPIELTTSPGVSPANQTFSISNTGNAPMSWSAAALPAWLSLSPSSGTVAIGGSTTLTVHFTIPGSDPAQTYNAALQLSDPMADNTLSVPVTVVAASLSKQWYFAEGYTGGQFRTYLTLANPNPSPTSATITYYLDTGGTVVVQRTLPANSRSTELVNDDVGSGASGHSVSIQVTASQGIVAERPMYFTYTGMGSGQPAIASGSDTLGATALSSVFDFGYIDTSTRHDTWLTVLNRDPSLSMDAQVTLFRPGGASPSSPAHTVTLVVAPASRGTLKVNEVAGLVPGLYSATVRLVVHGTTTPMAGLVERPLYGIDGGTGWSGAADVIGVPAASTSWSFAEGYSAWNFAERYVLANPCATADCSTTPTAHVQLTYLLSDGSQRPAAPVTLAPGQQVVLAAASTIGTGNVNNSVTVTSDQPILAERIQSFSYNGWAGMSDVLGATRVTQLYDFAEGYIFPNRFAEWLTIENPDASQTAQVQVTFLPPSGGAFTRLYSVAPHSRFTLNVGDVIGGDVSLSVESTLPIVAERPMYFNYNGSGQTGGTDIVGYQP